MTSRSPWTRPAIDFVDPRTLPFVEMRSRGELPHLYKEGGSYFVTFRLWDAASSSCGAAVPAAVEVQAGETPAPQAQAGETPAPQGEQDTVGKTLRQRWIEIQKEFDDEAALTDLSLAQQLAEIPEPPVTAGSCLLGRNDVAALVEGALLYFHNQRYLLTAWCVMPNHVHVTYSTLGGHMPENIHHSWKSFLSHEINRMLGRTGTLWERESFDHLIRSSEHYESYMNYIEQNPVYAGLCEKPADWKFSSARFLVA